MKSTKKYNCLEEYFYALDSMGFVRVEGFLSRAQLDHANSVIDHWHQAFLKQHGYTPVKYPFLELDPLFMDLMAHPLILKFCERFLGPWFRFDHAIGLQQPGFQKKRNGQMVSSEKGNLHGGPFMSQSSTFVFTSSDGNTWLGQLNVGLVLKEQSEEDGGFCYIAGSHKVPQPPIRDGGTVISSILHGNYNSPILTVPTLRAGDLIVFTEAIVHGVKPWKTKERLRRNVYFKFCPGFAAWQPYEKTKRYLDLARTEVQRRLLRPPFVASYDDEPTVEEHVYKEATIPGENQIRPIKNTIVRGIKKLTGTEIHG